MEEASSKAEDDAAVCVQLNVCARTLGQLHRTCDTAREVAQVMRRERDEAVARAFQMQRERDDARAEVLLWHQHSQHAYTYDDAVAGEKSCTADMQHMSHLALDKASALPQKIASPRTPHRTEGRVRLGKTVMDGVVYIHQQHTRASRLEREVMPSPSTVSPRTPRDTGSRQALQGREALCGVGITLVQPQKHGPIRISSITRGGSLWREMQENASIADARLQKLLPAEGDVLLAINGKAILDVTDAPDLVRGPQGSPVSILVGEASSGRPKAAVLLTRRPRIDA